MKKILILVEGQTEEQFTKDILVPVLLAKEIILVPVIIETKEVKSGPNFKGGINSYKKIKKDLLKLLGDTHAVAVTSMIDFYGLPSDFPLYSQTGDCYSKVIAAEEAFLKDICNDRFIPYLQLHEFEGILFTSPEDISRTMDTSGKTTPQLAEIRNRYHSPEEIDEGPSTHPSKRIEKLFPNYNKPFHGSLIASRIGIKQILDNCPHFHQWIEKLEKC